MVVAGARTALIAGSAGDGVRCLSMADEPAETFDASDAAAEANVRRDASRIVREDADVLRAIMHNKPGRAWLYRFLESCHIYGSTFAGEETHVGAFQQGEENVGKKLMLATQAASVDLYMTMIKEHQAEEARLSEVRRKERINRERETDTGTTSSAPFPDLPPPAGYPGGPPLPKPKIQGKRDK